MRRIWICVLSLTMLLTLVTSDAFAVKRSRGGSSHAKAKRASKGKHASAKLRDVTGASVAATQFEASEAGVLRGRVEGVTALNTSKP